MVFIAVWPSSRLIQFSHTFLSPCNIRRPPHHVCLCRLIPPVFSLFACPSDRADLHLACLPRAPTERPSKRGRKADRTRPLLVLCARSVESRPSRFAPRRRLRAAGGRRTEDGAGMGRLERTLGASNKDGGRRALFSDVGAMGAAWQTGHRRVRPGQNCLCGVGGVRPGLGDGRRRTRVPPGVAVVTPGFRWFRPPRLTRFRADFQVSCRRCQIF